MIKLKKRSEVNPNASKIRGLFKKYKSDRPQPRGNKRK
jgi:hypothetical protein